MISVTAINKAKADILKSLWMVISKGGFTFKSPNVTIHKIITGKTTSRTIIKNNKDKTCKEIGVGVKDVQEILSELSKTFDIATETTIECTIDSGYLKKSNWKYFKAAEITCYQNTGHKKIEEITYDLKNYSGELDGIFDQYQFRNT
jgi:hypothetical protein